MDEREALRDAVPKLALDAPLPGRRHACATSRGEVLDDRPRRAWPRARGSTQRRQRDGLPRSAARDRRAGKVPAERLLDHYHGEWGGDVSKVYDELSF